MTQSFQTINFISMQNERGYIFQIAPGSPYDDCIAALEDIKQSLELSKKENDEKKAAESAEEVGE